MSADAPIRVFLLDDHEVVRSGVRALLESSDGIEVVGEAATAAEALARVGPTTPDVAILDVQLPDGIGRRGVPHHPIGASRRCSA